MGPDQVLSGGRRLIYPADTPSCSLSPCGRENKNLPERKNNMSEKRDIIERLTLMTAYMGRRGANSVIEGIDWKVTFEEAKEEIERLRKYEERIRMFTRWNL